MPSMLESGTKVKYLYMGKWQKGVIHGVKTHEEPSGIITYVAYLIDTGETVREDITKMDKHGKVLETVRQPEQVELPQEFVKPL